MRMLPRYLVKLISTLPSVVVFQLMTSPTCLIIFFYTAVTASKRHKQSSKRETNQVHRTNATKEEEGMGSC